MGPIVFARGDEYETFGIGTSVVTDTGAELAIWEAVHGEPAPPLDDVAGVVLFGCSFNIEHADEQPFIGRLRDLTLDAFERGIPFLGICFGAQVAAWALDAPIAKAPVREVGYVPIHPTPALADDPVLGTYADGDMVFQWHMDTFTLPEGATLLATGEAVTNQAFRLGPASWATQFHFEIDRAEIELWTGLVADTVEQEWGKTPAQIVAEADRHQAAHETKGAEVFRRFVKVAREHA